MPLQFPFSRASGGEPMPAVPIVLLNRKGRRTPELLAIVDTGVDGTLVPSHILKAAGFQPNRQWRNLLTGRTDTLPERVIGYSLSLRIGAFELARVGVFGNRLVTDVVLGRDVLNQLVFTYDGPRRLLDILKP